MDEFLGWINQAPTPCVDAIARRTGLIGTRVSFPVDPYPGEGLADLIFRAASENGFRSPGALLELMGLKRNSRLSPLAFAKHADSLDTERISNVLGTSIPDAVRAIAPTGRLGGPDNFSFFGREVRSPMFFSKTRRIAPKTLSRIGYQKAIWSVLDFGFDPASKEKLISKCPACKGSLTFGKTYGVEFCGACFEQGKKVDLRDLPLDFVEDVDDVEALDVVTNLVNPDFPVGSFASLPLPSELMVSGPGPLFALLARIARAATKWSARTPNELYCQPSPKELAAIGRAAINWPDGMRDYGERLLQLKMDNLKTRAPLRARDDDLRHRRAYRISFNHPLSVLCAGYDKAIRDEVICAGVPRSSSRVLDSLMEVLDCSVQPAQTTVSSPGSEAYDPKRKFRSFSRVALESISRIKAGRDCSSNVVHTILAAMPNFIELSSSLGIAPPYLPDLIRSGLVEKIDDDIERLLRTNLRPDRPTLARRLAARACSGAPAEALSLHSLCVSLITRYVNPWPALLNLLLDGQLSFWISDEPGPLMKRILVRDFDKVVSVLSNASTQPDVYKAIVHNHGLAIGFGVNREVILCLRQRGFLQDLTLESVWQFRAKYIMISEIKYRLAMNSIYLNLQAIAHQAYNVTRFKEPPSSFGTVRFMEREEVEFHYKGRMFPKAT